MRRAASWLRLQGDSVRDTVQPRAQRSGLADPQTTGAADENQKRRLEGIIGCVHVVEGLPADRQDHWPVASKDDLERGLRCLVPPPCESLEQLAVGQANGVDGAEKLPEVSREFARYRARHEVPSAQENPSGSFSYFPRKVAAIHFFRHSSPNTTAEHPVLVPTVPVGMASSTLCVVVQRWTLERPGRHSHAEHGNETNRLRRFGLRQWPGGVERGASFFRRWWREGTGSHRFALVRADDSVVLPWR